MKCLNRIPLPQRGPGSSTVQHWDGAAAPTLDSAPNNAHLKPAFVPRALSAGVLINRTLTNCSEFHNGDSTVTDLQAPGV